jgi:hypothetical protein
MAKRTRKPDSSPPSQRQRVNGQAGDKRPAKPRGAPLPKIEISKSKSLKSLHAEALTPRQRWKNICDELAEDILLRDYPTPAMPDDAVSRMRERLAGLTKAALIDLGPLPETPQEKIAKLLAELRKLARAYERNLQHTTLEKVFQYQKKIWDVEEAEGLPRTYPIMELEKAERARALFDRQSITDKEKKEPRKRRKK